jgi:cytidine deaminase
MTATDAGVDVDVLVRMAWDARERAYAPYSRFRVGAAVATDAGVFVGANVENAAYPTGICAERTAGAAAVAAGARRFLTVAVVADSGPGRPPSTPCGQCRQFLREFDPDGTLRVIAEHPSGERRAWTLRQLLPDSFGPEDLGSSDRSSSR